MATARKPAAKAPAKPPAKAKATTKAPSPARAPVNDIPLLEWIAAGIGLVLASTAVGFTAWDAVFGETSPPSIEVRLVAVNPTPHGFVAQVEAINHGGAPASQVMIEGVLGDDQETASATFDYIPEQSHATGGLIFEGDPRKGPLKLRAKGFIDPS